MDAADRVLWRDGVELPLTLKAAEILLALLENSGHVVEKNTLLARVWPGTFVEESTLAQNILTLRKTLGRQSDKGEYIRTVPRRGYRFDSPVSINGEAIAVAPAVAPEKLPVSSSSSMGYRLLIGIATLVVLIVAALVALWFRAKPTSRVAETRMRLAVLPFANLSGDASQDYLSEGLTEEMITQIGSLDPDRLTVIARTSAMAYRNSSRSAHEIGRELKVDFLLEGSVRRGQDRIRVSTQLIRASDESSLWTANYDRELRDILTLEGDVSRSVASQIRLHLSSKQASRLEEARPVDAQAYELYLKGRHFWNRRTPETIDKAIQLLQQAIARDPSYARAHAALADCYVIEPIYRESELETDSLKLAQAEANRALELDPSLGEAHATIAYSYFYEWDFPAAEAEFQKSIRLTPRYATAHQWYAEYLRMMGRQQDAIAESDRALEIDPLSPIINVEAALPYYYLGQNDKAAAQLLRIIDLDPYFASAHGHLCQVYDSSGQYRRALQECLAAKALGDANWIEESLGCAYVHNGQPEKAREILRRTHSSTVYVALGDKEGALSELEQSLARREPTLVGLKVDQHLAAIRDEPRFQNMLRRMGFPD
jgi:TolB-like protein/DNA-binding winged helix-turn-helix (wHTH) protein/Tfp pilus assembly protein PilF